MDEFTIYCTESQTRKALELGAPIENHNYTFGNNETCTYLGKDYTKLPALDWFAQQPTAEQMIGWLEEQGLLISITARNTPDNPIYNYSINRCEESWTTFSSRKEATLAAIDEALDYLVSYQKKTK